MKKLYLFTLLFTLFLGFSSNAQVVISQVYGGGGNSGATLNRDYVELFNRGSVAIDMTGWSIQYNSATGVNAWNFNAIPSGATIQPGKYYLIAFGTPGATGTALPTADFDSTTLPLNLSGTTGKLVLANIATALPAGGCPTTPSQVVDAVSFGPTALCFEGTGPAPIISSILADFRASSGCTDTNNNSTDFTSATPSPRNSSSAINTCVLSVKQDEISGLSMYPNPVVNGYLYISTDKNTSKEVGVFDILGKQVLKTTTVNNTVNVSSLKGGVYFVKITEDGKTATRKLIIK